MESLETLNCPYCGGKIGKSTLFCPFCGKRVPEDLTRSEPAKPVGSTGSAQMHWPDDSDTAPADPTPAPSEMPKKGVYLTFLIFGFIFGVLWGILASSHYRNMKASIASGDARSAWESAGKVRMFFFIGLGVNVFVFLIRLMAGF